MLTQPNIVILMTDQQRGDCLSCAGHPVVRTPNMDRLAAEGVRFSRAYTTSPICMPARSSFLTGLYCHNHRQWDNRGHCPPEADNYLRHAKAAGYHTCHVGKSHLYPHDVDTHLSAHIPFMNQLGFDDVLEVTGPHATRRTDSIVTDRWRELGCLDTFRDDYTKRVQTGPTATWPSPMPQGETLDDFVGRTTVEYIDGYERDEPMLLFAGFGGPHEPWDPPAEWAAQYDPAAMDPMKPPTEPGVWVPAIAAEHQRNQQKLHWDISPEVSGRIRALYYAKISHIDWWFGQILASLETRGMLDNTAIIFWSDHGEMLCDKGRLHKSVFYEESVHVPLIVRPPQCTHPGAVCEALVSQIDCVPTIAEFAGSEEPVGGFGQSLSPMLNDPSASGHDAVFSEIHNRTMIRDDRYKMVTNNQGTVLKLYDMVDDPEEEQNLVGLPEVETAISDLKCRTLDWLLATQWKCS